MKQRNERSKNESNSRFAAAATRRPTAALVALCFTAACGGAQPDADPLASIAASVAENERTPAELMESWRREPEVSLTLRPAVGENAVYLAQADRLAAWDVADGRPLWPPVVFDSDISAAPIAIGDQVVVATGGDEAGVGPRVWWLGSDSTLIRQSPVDATLTELGAVAGTLVYIDESGVGRLGDPAWHTAVDGAESITLVADHGLAVVTAADGTLTAFDLGSGAQRWQYDAGGPVTRPALAGNRLFIAAGELGGVRAIAVADGRLQWERRLGTAVAGAPAYAQDLVWVAAFDARLRALKAGNGTLMGGLTVELSSRNYLDLASFDPWVVAGPLYGPWVAVRGPTRVEREDFTVRVPVPQPNTAGRPDLEIPAGVGPAGVAVVNGNGSVSFLQPQRAR